MSRRAKEDAPKIPAPDPVRSSRWPALVVALITFAAFVPSIAHPFVVWDDGANFVENPHYRGLGPEQLEWMFTTFHLGPYQPLSWVTLGLDWTLWGLDATGYHLTNVLIHAVAAAFACLFATRVFEAWARGPARSATFFGVAVALLWSLHPLRVEAVSWVTERREVLSGAFAFAALYVSARGGRWWSIGILSLCAMLAKGTTVVLAPLLILADVFASKETGARELFTVALRSARRHAAVIATAAVIVPLAIVGQRSADAMVASEALGLFERLRLFANGIGFYVVKTVWPFGLAPMYDPPADRAALNIPALVSLLGLAAFLVVTWRARARIGHVWIIGVAYVVSLLPVGGLVPVGSQLAADRYSYVPGACITLALVACVGLVAARSWSTVARWSVLVLACVGLAWRTFEMQTIWSSSKALWLHELREYSDSPIAHLHLGLLFTEGKDPESTPADAERHFRAALARSPKYADAWCALGDLLSRSGRATEALAAYDAAVESEPRHRASWASRATAQWRAGRRDDALASLRRLSELAPRDYQPHMLIGRALAAAGDVRGSLAEYERALTLGANAVRPPTELAWLLATHPDAAVRNGARALELARSAAARFGDRDPLVVQALTAALAETGHFDEALTILLDVRRGTPAGQSAELDALIAQFQAHQPLRVEPTYP